MRCLTLCAVCAAAPLLAGASAFAAGKTLGPCPVSTGGLGYLAAVASGDLLAVRRAVANGQPVDCADPASGLSPLGIAAREGRVELVQALLDLGADPNYAPHPQLRTPPLRAAFAPSATGGPKSLALVEALARLLVARGASPTQRFVETALGKETSLAGAAALLTPEELALALSVKADANACDANGTCPFEHAVESAKPPWRASDAAIVRKLDLLSGAGAHPPVEVERAERLLRFAIEACLPLTFARLGTAGLHLPHGSPFLPTAVALAAGCGDEAAFNAALDAGADPLAIPAGAASTVALAVTTMTSLSRERVDAGKARKLIGRLLEAVARAKAAADARAAAGEKPAPHAKPVIDIRAADRSGVTLLMLAARNADKPLFSTIAVHDDRWEQTDRQNKSLAWYAGAGGNIDILATLGRKLDLTKATTPALLPLAAATEHGAAAAVDYLLARHAYSPDILTAIADGVLQRAGCERIAGFVADTIAKLVEAGANPTGLRARLACDPQADRRIAVAAERRRRAQASAQPAAMQLVIWGGGPDAALADRWLGSYKALAPKMSAWVAPARGFPRRLRADSVPGLSADQELVVLAACPAGELDAALATWKAFNPGVYVRDVSWPARDGGCPWVVGAKSSVRKTAIIARDTAPVSLAILEGQKTRVYAATALARDGSLVGFVLEPDSTYVQGCPRGADYREDIALHPAPQLVLSCRTEPRGGVRLDDIYKLVIEPGAVRFEHVATRP